MPPLALASFDISAATITTATSEIKEKLNDLIPPSGARVLTDAKLEKSAIGTGYTIIPLPAFTFNRNEGAWIGGLTPIFRANAKGEVEDIYAPLYLHNKLVGETFTFNYFGYRDKTAQYHAILSHATKVERVVDFSYRDTGAEDGHYILGAQANSGKSAFNRFYGFGNRVSDQTETIYTMGDSNLKLTGGVNVTPELSILATERYRVVALENGVSPVLPQTLDKFPDTPGVDGANVLGHGLTLSYDTRDNQLTPIHGTYATLFGEYDQNLKFTERNQWWRVTGEFRNFLPHADGRMVLVTHALVDGVVGQDENATLEDFIEQDTGLVDADGNPIFQTVSAGKRVIRRGVPFYERPSLGGETTMRAFGRGRFVSNVAILFNVEERISLVQKQIMGNVLEVEVAPFLDMGRVGRSFSSEGVVKNMQLNPGVGLRVLARPNIAGRLDVGYGRDGANVYVGLDYPF